MLTSLLNLRKNNSTLIEGNSFRAVNISFSYHQLYLSGLSCLCKSRLNWRQLEMRREEQILSPIHCGVSGFEVDVPPMKTIGELSLEVVVVVSAAHELHEQLTRRLCSSCDEDVEKRNEEI